ncbi:glycoside hydrolase family 99-like domain-containing protein [Akkermansiaceae bacterium]|nr:glycoside hydrolase family 99-like domain-containing protein [Akkermansiaceae bacterium]
MTVAFYLPQFHPISENDEWWGKGFTEWTNVGKAKKLFPGHYQPKVPKDLGYYDLRLKESRIAQAMLAKEYGIDGFNYWHYWFGGGRTLLEGPLTKVINEDLDIKIPFALAWANHSWTGIWNNEPSRKLLEQKYPGRHDMVNHFSYCLNAFKDKRYIRKNGHLLFTIYRPLDLKNCEEFLDTWRDLAVENGFKGFYFVGISNQPKEEFQRIKALGFDAVNSFGLKDGINKSVGLRKYFDGFSRKFFGGGLKLSAYDYGKVMRKFNNEIDILEDVVPTILPNWDTSPRSGKRGLILKDSSPDRFKVHLKKVKSIVDAKKNKLVFLKSWNEWAEGNYMEPDLRYGCEILEVYRDVFGE